MSKISIRKWSAPVDPSVIPPNVVVDDDGNVHITEIKSPVMSSKDGYHPIIANIDGIDGANPVTLTPDANPAASNYFHTNKLCWVAQYADGSIITQFDSGEEQTVDKLSRENLRRFSMVDSTSKILCSQDLVPGQMFFYRKRTAMRPGQDIVEIIHIFGWRRATDGNQDSISVLFVYESDLHIEAGGFHHPSRAVHPKEWRHPIVWHESDLVPII